MSLANLADKIAANAMSEADAIIAEAKAEVKKIKSAAQAEADELTSGLLQSAEQEASQLGTEMSAAARQHNQKKMLIAKREQLDATRLAVQDVVSSASLKGRINVLKSLIAEAGKEGSKDMVLRPVTLDRQVLEDIGGKYEIGADIDGLGGFILEADGGAVSLDYRFDSRLQAACDDNLAEVTNELFS